jgi:hypothetical protein
MSANETASVLKLHPCHVCGRQPALVEDDPSSPVMLFQYRCQCTEEHSVSTFMVLTAEQAAAEWNRMNEPCEAPFPRTEAVQHPVVSFLKPCPFCGEKPELRKCPNPAERGWLVRCLCNSGLICAETFLQPTVETAAAAWNTRAQKQRFTFSKQHVPFGLFLGGTFLFSVGCGFFDNSVAAFFSAFGASVAVSSLFLQETVDRAKQEICDAELARQCASVAVTLRPDLPPCPLCGEIPALHKVGSGRFYMLCTNSRCWASSKLQPTHCSAEESARVWTEEYVPQVLKNRGIV